MCCSKKSKNLNKMLEKDQYVQLQNSILTIKRKLTGLILYIKLGLPIWRHSRLHERELTYHQFNLITLIIQNSAQTKSNRLTNALLQQ